MVVRVPMIFPVLGGADWRDSYGDLRGAHRHTGQDLRAPKMTPIVAPFSGRIGVKKHSFWIYGDNGWRCLGTHLNDDTPGSNDGRNNWDFMFAANIQHGGKVIAGQLIGWVGNSGDATGPHLHFELHGPKGIRNPALSLKMAQHIRYPRPNLPPFERPDSGEELWFCHPRIVKADKMQVVVTARRMPDSSRHAESKPRFETVWTHEIGMMYSENDYLALSVRKTESGWHVSKAQVLDFP